MTEAYITGVGAYLPGDPVGNTELAVICECAHARLRWLRDSTAWDDTGVSYWQAKAALAHGDDGPAS